MRIEIPPPHLCMKNRDCLNTERGVVTDATQVTAAQRITKTPRKRDPRGIIRRVAPRN